MNLLRLLILVILALGGMLCGKIVSQHFVPDLHLPLVFGLGAVVFGSWPIYKRFGIVPPIPSYHLKGCTASHYLRAPNSTQGTCRLLCPECGQKLVLGQSYILVISGQDEVSGRLDVIWPQFMGVWQYREVTQNMILKDGALSKLRAKLMALLFVALNLFKYWPFVLIFVITFSFGDLPTRLAKWDSRGIVTGSKSRADFLIAITPKNSERSFDISSLGSIDAGKLKYSSALMVKDSDFFEHSRYTVFKRGGESQLIVLETGGKDFKYLVTRQSITPIYIKHPLEYYLLRISIFFIIFGITIPFVSHWILKKYPPHVWGLYWALSQS